MSLSPYVSSLLAQSAGPQEAFGPSIGGVFSAYNLCTASLLQPSLEVSSILNRKKFARMTSTAGTSDMVVAGCQGRMSGFFPRTFLICMGAPLAEFAKGGSRR